MSKTTSLRFLLPITVFVPISCFSFYLIFNTLFPYAVKLKLVTSAPCPTNYDGMFRRQYFNGFFPAAESRLCRLVSFFYPVVQVDREYRHFMIASFTNFAAVVCSTFVEASRMLRGSIGSLWILLPTIIGIIYQLYTGAASLPVFWILLIAGQRQGLVRRAPVITKPDSEAISLGLALGYIVPTYLMLFHSDVPSIALWQFFPVIMGLVCGAYLFLRPRSNQKSDSSGYTLIQTTYGVLFISLVVVNVTILKANNFDFAKMIKACLPPLTLELNSTILRSFADLAAVTLKWDFLLIFTGTFLATLWFGENTKEVLGLAAWYAGANLLLGAGPAIIGVLMWREWKLKQSYGKVKGE